jgi:hypothetical protein
VPVTLLVPEIEPMALTDITFSWGWGSRSRDPIGRPGPILWTTSPEIG